MKNKGHTGTLFFENGRYRWSYKYDHCIQCKTCDYKHKGRGLCMSCWDYERKNKVNRKKSIKIASIRFSYRRRVKFWLVHEPQKKGPKPMKESEKKSRKQIMKDYNKKNREVINIKNKVKRRLKKGLPCMKAYWKGKEIILPFETLEKPATTSNPKYEERKKNVKDFEILKSFYNK